MSHAHWRPCFLMNQDKNRHFVRESPNNCFCYIILKSGLRLIFNDILKDFPIGCHGIKSSAWNTILYSYFQKGPPKDTATNL